MRRPIPVVLFALLTAGALYAQQPAPGRGAPPGLLDAATKMLAAITARDTGYLGRVGDPRGITLGTDGDQMSLAQWRRQLSSRQGAYCVVLDAACLRPPADSSLRDLLASQRVVLQVHAVAEYPDVFDVAVTAASNSDYELFTLILRRVAGQWRLIALKYT